MGGEIIAEKFALLKTRGGNGVAFTHIVEDTMLGSRAVVKVSGELEDLGLDYLKAINLAREAGVSGVLMPFEGGILEEGEGGYYLAFPELGEPSLENYLRMGAPLSCREILEICDQALEILENLHAAGLLHLFVNPRNVFYRPRQGVTLKDPALRREFFHPFLELIATPDFYYFSPAVMDGVLPGKEADLYAVGKLAERLLEHAVDVDASPDRPTVGWLAGKCRSAGAGTETPAAAGMRRELAEVSVAAGLRRELAEMRVAAGRCMDPVGVSPMGLGPDRRRGDDDMQPGGLKGSRPPGGRERGRRQPLWTALSLVLLLVLTCGIAFALVLTGEEQKAPALDRSGGSAAGGEVSRKGISEVRDRPQSDVPMPDPGKDGEASEAASPNDTGDDHAAAASPAGGIREDGAAGTSPPDDPPAAPPAAPPADPSPEAPVASFTVSPGEGRSPLQVYLDAAASYDPDGSIVSYAWSCGGSGASLYHVFESNVIPATITITLTVTDDGGHSASATRSVTLY